MKVKFMLRGDPPRQKLIFTGTTHTLQITSKGQVTIPQEVRNRLGLLPHTEVEFVVAGDHAVIRKLAPKTNGAGQHGMKALEALRGTADAGFSTDAIMALTRSEDESLGRAK